MNVRPIERLLESMELFSDLDAEDLAFVAGCGRNVQFHEGEWILREGELSEYFYVLRTGRVTVEASAPGRGAIVIDTAEPGEVAGVSWLFPPYRWGFDARASEPVRAVAFDATCLREKCDQNPRLGYLLMRRFAALLNGRLQSARLRLLDLYGHVPR